MKKFAFAVLLAVTSLYSHAIDGHNGIRFNMTQQQVEKMGFTGDKWHRVSSWFALRVSKNATGRGLIPN